MVWITTVSLNCYSCFALTTSVWLMKLPEPIIHTFFCTHILRCGLELSNAGFFLLESRLAAIARLGRVFGIHLILATQRPDANLLSGQIRNNLNCRICGRADNILSQLILDNTDAANQIPKDAKGRFMLHDGTVFQGYLFDEKIFEQ